MISAKVKVDVSPLIRLRKETEQRRITLKGVKAGAKVLKTAAKAEAPKRPGSGALQAAQAIVAKKGRKGKTVSFAVQGAKKKYVKLVRVGRSKKEQKAVPAFYDHLVQLGTKAHAVAAFARLARNGKAAVGQSGTAKQHPGAKANPYRKRAWERVKGEAGQATVKAMADELNKVMAREALKGAQVK